jgi:hypothetical protein
MSSSIAASLLYFAVIPVLSESYCDSIRSVGTVVFTARLYSDKWKFIFTFC